MDSSTPNPAPGKFERNFNPKLFWATIIAICAIIFSGSFFVTRSYQKYGEQIEQDDRPIFGSRLERDLDLINRDGQEVALGQLKGKIWVAGYQYTDCPSGCLGLAAIQSRLQQEFSSDPRFHLVSISLDPKEDTPEKMDEWVKDHGVDEPNWWFVTGDENEIRSYMMKYFKFYGRQENTDPAQITAYGKYSHDQRLALVDGMGNVRGWYEVMDADFGEAELEKLRKDIRFLLNQKETKRGVNWGVIYLAILGAIFLIYVIVLINRGNKREEPSTVPAA